MRRSIQGSQKIGGLGDQDGNQNGATQHSILKWKFVTWKAKLLGDILVFRHICNLQSACQNPSICRHVTTQEQVKGFSDVGS
jgi:hypothetical protein